MDSVPGALQEDVQFHTSPEENDNNNGESTDGSDLEAERTSLALRSGR